MIVKILSFLFFILISNSILSQKAEADLTINILANEKIAEVNIDQEKFISSVVKLTDYCKIEFKDIPDNQRIGILFIAHKSRKPTFKIFSEPIIDKNFQMKIMKDLTEIEVENTKIVDFPFFIYINNKNEEGNIDFDGFINPEEEKLNKFKSANISSKLELLKEYAALEVIPILSKYEQKADGQFKGVQNIGVLLEKTNFSQVQNIDILFNKNNDYWRAVMEMGAGNQIIPLSKIAALVSQGEIDMASRYLDILSIFSNSKSIADKYLDELSLRIGIFKEDVNSEINIGIAQHDKGEYKKAITIYSDLLKVYPNSAWALYEKYFSESAIGLKSGDVSTEKWDNAKIEIFKHDPLYSAGATMNSGKAAYLFFRSKEISELFKTREKMLSDVYKYGEIASDLDVYDFAAQMFWISVTYDEEMAAKSINNYLFCLEKLGVTELKSNFEGDFDNIFKSIEEEKENTMKSNTFYKAFKN